MPTHLVLTVIGPDRPGLVSVLSDTIAAGGGNWLDSRMASLAGTVRRHSPGRRRVRPGRRVCAPRFSSWRGWDCAWWWRKALSSPPLWITGAGLKLELIGQDRPGIVRDISRVLAEHQVSIGEFHTERSSASFSGEAMFKATAMLSLPAGLDERALQRALEGLANELMVDLELRGS